MIGWGTLAKYVAAPVVASVVAFGAGWKVQSWRLGLDLEQERSARKLVEVQAKANAVNWDRELKLEKAKVATLKRSIADNNTAWVELTKKFEAKSRAVLTANSRAAEIEAEAQRLAAQVAARPPAETELGETDPCCAAMRRVQANHLRRR